MFYRNILKQSWENTWRNKFLWFFGIFAAFLGGQESGIIYQAFNLNNFEAWNKWQSLLKTGLLKERALHNIQNMIASDKVVFYAIFFILFVILFLFLFLFLLGVVSQVALVKSASNFYLKKKNSFKSLLNVGVKKLFPAIALNLIFKIVIFALFVLINFILLQFFVFSQNLMISGLVFIVAFMIFVPLAFSLSFVFKYALAYFVIENKKIKESLSLSFGLFLKNWLISLEMALILSLFSFGAVLFLFFVFSLISIPFLLLILLLGSFAFGFLFWFFFFLGMASYLLIIILVGSILHTFQISVWSILFMNLIKKKGDSKLNRLFSKK